ncbi:type IX secretion system outer membrane channel protein PorV [Bacteroidota bacterium]
MIKECFVTLSFILIWTSAISQTINETDRGITGQELGDDLNPVNSAVPFLTIAPDSRAGAMGDVGVATSPDANSMHWNPAKFAFLENDLGISLSYTPWLRKLVNDIDLVYLTGYKSFRQKQALGFSLYYFSLGEITFTNARGEVIRPGNPNEFSLDAAYSRLLSNNYSMGVSFRYIHSNLSGGAPVEGTDTRAGNAVAFDVSGYYTNNFRMERKPANIGIGFNLSNIGSKISYTEITESFLPMNMRLGSALEVELDDYNSLTFALDFNKLMVPTTPVYYPDSTDENGDPVLLFGKGDLNASVPVAIFSSFYDAPGVMENGKRKVWREELREVTIGFGVEYWYAKQFAIRGGYFHEHETKGNRKYFSLGIGLKLNVFGLDVSYLIPRNFNNALANTIRFSLLFNFEPEKR